jgi:hypothetical protein
MVMTIRATTLPPIEVGHRVYVCGIVKKRNDIDPGAQNLR